MLKNQKVYQTVVMAVVIMLIYMFIEGIGYYSPRDMFTIAIGITLFFTMLSVSLIHYMLRPAKEIWTAVEYRRFDQAIVFSIILLATVFCLLLYAFLRFGHI